MKTQLYRFYDKNNVLLYIGISVRFASRLVQHKKSKEWFDDIAKIELESHPTVEDALSVESEAIRNEEPLYNVAHNSGSILSNSERHAAYAEHLAFLRRFLS